MLPNRQGEGPVWSGAAWEKFGGVLEKEAFVPHTPPSWVRQVERNPGARGRRQAGLSDLFGISHPWQLPLPGRHRGDVLFQSRAAVVSSLSEHLCVAFGKCELMWAFVLEYE